MLFLGAAWTAGCGDDEEPVARTVTETVTAPPDEEEPQVDPDPSRGFLELENDFAELCITGAAKDEDYADYIDALVELYEDEGASEDNAMLLKGARGYAEEYGCGASADREKLTAALGDGGSASGGGSSSGSTQEFSGNGTRNLGTIEVSQDSKLEWTNDGGFFGVLSDDGGISISSEAADGESAVPAGTYNDVEVIAVGDWTITIGP